MKTINSTGRGVRSIDGQTVGEILEAARRKDQSARDLAALDERRRQRSEERRNAAIAERADRIARGLIKPA